MAPSWEGGGAVRCRGARTDLPPSPQSTRQFDELATVDTAEPRVSTLLAEVLVSPRLLMVCTFLLAPVVSNAGDACKGFKVKEDEFSDATAVLAPIQLLSALRAIGMHMEAKGGEATLTMTIKEGGAVDGVIPVGVVIPFKLEDGTILELTTSRENATKSYVSGQQVMTLMPHTLGLDRATLEKLRDSPVQMVRLPLSSGEYDWSASKKVRKTMTSAAACVLEHLDG